MHCCPHNTDKFVELGLLFPDVWLGDSPKAKSRDRLLPKDLSRIQSENEEDLYPWHLLKGGAISTRVRLTQETLQLPPSRKNSKF